MTDNPPTHGSRTPADEELARLRRQAFGPGAPETDPESTAVRMPAVGADAPPPPPTSEDEAPDDVAPDPAQTSPGEGSPVDSAPVDSSPLEDVPGEATGAGEADAVADPVTTDDGVDADPTAVDGSADRFEARAVDASFDDAPADATRDVSSSDASTAAVPVDAGSPDAAGEGFSSSARDNHATATPSDAAASSDAASAEAAEHSAGHAGDQTADQRAEQATDHAGEHADEQASDETGAHTADPASADQTTDPAASDPEPTASTPADPNYSPHDTSDFTPLFAETRAARERGSSAATATSADEAGASGAVGAGADARTDANTDDGEATTSTAIPVVPAAAGSSTGSSTSSTTSTSPARDLPDTWSSSAPQDAPHRRGAGTHIWVLLVSLVLIPVAWYLLTDAGARLTAGTNTSWVTGDIELAHVGELAAGAVLVFLAILLVRVSASGAWLWGAIATVLGAAWVAVPGPLSDLISPVLDGMRDLASVGSIGENMADHLIVDGTSGRLLVYGLALLAIALTVGGARRSGRAEGEFDAEERRATASRV